MVKLFCMPWAGGASYCYNFWNSTDEIEVIPIEYSGHGKRFGEKLSYEFTDLIHDCLRQIVSGEEDDVCLFGHSMGALAHLNVPMPFQPETESQNTCLYQACALRTAGKRTVRR